MYKLHGIEQLQLPTLDTTPPSLEHLRDGVAFVRDRLTATGGRGRIYIHCKGGRGRASCDGLRGLASRSRGCCVVAVKA